MSDDKGFDINLNEITTESHEKTGMTEVKTTYGPCRDGNHNACRMTDCPCAKNKHDANSL